MTVGQKTDKLSIMFQLTAFGVIGMLLAVLLCSVLYALVREHIAKKNTQHLPEQTIQ